LTQIPYTIILIITCNIFNGGRTESTEVKANIKLRFLNKQSKATVVVRNLQLTKKRAKLEYKALEGVVRMTNDVGENVINQNINNNAF